MWRVLHHRSPHGSVRQGQCPSKKMKFHDHLATVHEHKKTLHGRVRLRFHICARKSKRKRRKCIYYHENVLIFRRGRQGPLKSKGRRSNSCCVYQRYPRRFVESGFHLGAHATCCYHFPNVFNRIRQVFSFNEMDHTCDPGWNNAAWMSYNICSVKLEQCIRD